MASPTHTVTVPIDVPPEVEREARRRATEAGTPERFEAYLLEHIEFDFQYRLQGDDPCDDPCCSSAD